MNIAIQNIFLIAVTIINLLLGSFIYFQNRKSKINRVYAVIVYAVSGWALTNAGFQATNEPKMGILWAVLSYISAIIIVAGFFYFSLIFPKKLEDIRSLHRKIVFLSVPIMVFITSIPGFVWKNVVLDGYKARRIVTGPGLLLYGGYLLFFFAWGLLKLARKYHQAKGISKTQLKYVFFGIFLSVIGGVFFNLILPLMKNYRYVWLGPNFTIIMVIFFAYAILKHHLFDIKVIATELFTGLLTLVLFINIFTYETFGQLILNIGIFLGALIFGILLIRSVLREIKAKEQLKEAYEELKKLDKAKSEFISIASHQLRTPLTAIKGYISMILEGSYGKLNKRMRKSMENVYQSNERLIKLVNDLLNISRMEAGKVEFKPERISMEEVISSVVEELKIKADEKDIYLKWEGTGKLPKIMADYDKIRQVVLNIVDNAIRYTQEGGVTISTQLKMDYEEEKMIIKVEDTGEGLTKEELGHLFESFSRGTAGTRLYTEGVGLGLHVAKKFVEMHDGRIWAQSEGRGKGSTFFIELPIK